MKRKNLLKLGNYLHFTSFFSLKSEGTLLFHKFSLKLLWVSFPNTNINNANSIKSNPTNITTICVLEKVTPGWVGISKGMDWFHRIFNLFYDFIVIGSGLRWGKWKQPCYKESHVITLLIQIKLFYRKITNVWVF